MLDAREELSTIMLIGDQKEQREEDKLAIIVNGIFRDRGHNNHRRLSPP